MQITRLIIQFKNQQYHFDLNFIHSLQHLIQSIRHEVPSLCYSFVLLQNKTDKNIVDSPHFDKLKNINKPFNLYVLPTKKQQDNLQDQFGRLKISENANQSEQIQISFNDSQSQKVRQTQSSQEQQQFYNEPKIIKQKLINEQVVHQKYIKLKKQQQQTIGIQVQCDICFAFPIKGQLFKCLVCQNFDLCALCQQHYHHFHPVLMINKKQNYPTEIDIVFSQQSEKYMSAKLEQEKGTLRQIKKVMYEKDEDNNGKREVDPAFLTYKHVKAGNFLSCLIDSK